MREYVPTWRHANPENLLGIAIDIDAMWGLRQNNVDIFRSQPFPDEKSGEKRFFLIDSLFPYADAITLLAMLSHFSAQTHVEIGSSFSTACMLDCADLVGLPKPQITCVEPYPTRIQQLLKANDYDNVSVIDQALQNIRAETITRYLEPGDPEALARLLPSVVRALAVVEKRDRP